ncbi:histidine kinase [Haloterrigena salifodinae]|uniref:histidine kinase n=1 Tax=Haloterrigena salifodinae TaxID=2675099 RepID=A0A8T8E1F9_9EURY|nr:ATP-binding protein [Haloterrigena salifodinae]QRV15316.1 histidine kinase [Haloterrigena salifodinae]
MIRWHRVITVAGVVLAVVALATAAATLADGGTALEAVLDVFLISAPGLVLLSVGVWLPGTDIDPDLHPRIAAWIVGGIAVMVGLIALRAADPAVDVTFTVSTQTASVATGSIAGLAVGVHEARAITHSRTLERQNEELKEKHAVERRNDELEATKAQLERANARLEASNERLEEFAYAASHDLQEPLRMISSYLQLIERRYADALDEDGQEFIDFAVDGADRMRRMIDGLLEYSRVETQGDPFESVDLDAVLDDVLTDLQLRIEETDAAIAREPLPTVTGDAGQLRQVFQNLLSNALEYSGDDPPRVAVSAEETGSEWVIAVRDEGIGIDPADIDRIFALFQRLHSVEESVGSGIGLAVCKRIVERHGGEIRVDSEPGEGSTFSVAISQSRAEKSIADGRSARSPST